MVSSFRAADLPEPEHNHAVYYPRKHLLNEGSSLFDECTTLCGERTPISSKRTTLSIEYTVRTEEYWSQANAMPGEKKRRIMQICGF
jgi:hypothetical protein